MLTVDMMMKKLDQIVLKIQQYTVHEQIEILQYYVVYLLKDKSRSEALAICRSMLNQRLEEAPLGALIQEGVNNRKINIVNLVGLNDDVRESDVENLDVILVYIAQLRKKLNDFISGDKENKISKEEFESLALIDLIDASQEKIFPKESLDETVKEMFDRVIDSLDPFTAKNYLDQSVERSGVALKAALFDAMCEKHEQVKVYHQTGLLLKDFSRLYAKNIRGKNSN